MSHACQPHGPQRRHPQRPGCRHPSGNLAVHWVRRSAAAAHYALRRLIRHRHLAAARPEKISSNPHPRTPLKYLRRHPSTDDPFSDLFVAAVPEPKVVPDWYQLAGTVLSPFVKPHRTAAGTGLGKWFEGRGSRARRYSTPHLRPMQSCSCQTRPGRQTDCQRHHYPASLAAQLLHNPAED
jgi:hypothetical protein